MDQVLELQQLMIDPDDARIDAGQRDFRSTFSLTC